MDQQQLSYDVVVVGGGAAGLAAAIAAAGEGAHTALVERYGFLGGMATAGMVSTICGLYLTRSSGPPEPLNPGFAETFAHRLARMPGGGEPVRRGRTFVLPYTPFAFTCLADQVAASMRSSASGRRPAPRPRPWPIDSCRRWSSCSSRSTRPPSDPDRAWRCCGRWPAPSRRATCPRAAPICRCRRRRSQASWCASSRSAGSRKS